MVFKNDPISTVWESVKAINKRLKDKIVRVSMVFTLSKTVEIGSFLKAII
jgi:hypothetical protein